jgi:segregation and condensation protein B
LFYKTESVKKADLAALFNTSGEDITRALESLRIRLESGGTRLVQTDTDVQLVSAPELSELIEQLRKDELKKDIGKAGAETLAIILYRGPLTRADIDRVRGVNSTFILRNLLIRGLIERRPNPRNKLSFLYAATTDLLNHLGISRREELPQFAEIMDALDTFEKEQGEQETNPGTFQSSQKHE